jgi:glucose-6-phosphate 1-dehydrogenase
VARVSSVETFVALRLFIDSWRWADVPFYIRGRQVPAADATEVLVELKRPPRTVFRRRRARSISPTTCVLGSAPRLSSRWAHAPRLRARLWSGEQVELMVRNQQAESIAPYERLLSDALFR